jgi:glutamyl-Q tRNA(Asp) synthetase
MGTIYPGTCRDGCSAKETAIRLRTNDKPISFVDGLQGTQTQRLESESGDFIIRRRDGLVAYQLAVVVDDALEGITEIVRGIDIMDSTQRQIWPVITHPNGDKLSKLTGAPGIPLDTPQTVLVAALAALKQGPPTDLTSSSIPDIWLWAVENWKIEPLRGLTAVISENLSANSLTGTP